MSRYINITVQRGPHDTEQKALQFEEEASDEDVKAVFDRARQYLTDQEAAILAGH